MCATLIVSTNIEVVYYSTTVYSHRSS